MNQNQNQNQTQKSGGIFDDKCMLNDLLNSEKHLTGIYNANLCESATTSVQNCLSSILNDTHTIQKQVFNEMSTRGWYPVEKAEDTKLNQTKQKYSQSTQVNS